MIPAAILPGAAVQHTLTLAGWRWDDPALEAWTRQQLPRALDRRRVEFAAGRTCAARAASVLLDRPVHPTEIGRDAAGGPRWPDRLVGSLAHCRELAGAVVMPRPASGESGIGLDIEPVMPAARVHLVQKRIVTPDECDGMRHAYPLTDAEATTLAFCVKEALFKCLHPLVGRMFSFHDAWIGTVTATEAPAGGLGGADADFRVSVRMETGLSDTVTRGRQFEAGVSVRAGIVFAVVALSSDPDLRT